MHRTRTVVITTTLLLVTAGCGVASEQPDPRETAADDSWERGSEPWTGVILAGGADVTQSAHVSIDVVPELPAAAPAYYFVAPTPDDLERLAELHAGGPVEPGIMPGGSPDLIGFDAGDGWFHAHRDSLADDHLELLYDDWSWTQRSWRESPPPGVDDELLPCPAGTPVPAAIEHFLAPLGIDIQPTGRMECAGPITRVRFDVLLDGLRILGSGAYALVDAEGDVVEASAPFMTFAPLGDLELAPVAEVLRRLVDGPGTVPPMYRCSDPCVFSTRDASLALSAFRIGGLGHHDHTPSNVVPGRDEQLLLPVLRAPARGATDTLTRHLDAQSALALSSALLVDDPDHAEAAREADSRQTLPYVPGSSGCAGLHPTVLVCSSSFAVAVGEPVVLTLAGEANIPVGASECDLLLDLDTGDGRTYPAPPPRVGTLVSSRLVHSYDEAGTYTVTVHRASRCQQPAPGGGTEPEYDDSAHVTVTVTER